eukprot:6177696-Pleurochrysis_carterae.AAC.3
MGLQRGAGYGDSQRRDRHQNQNSSLAFKIRPGIGRGRGLSQRLGVRHCAHREEGLHDVPLDLRLNDAAQDGAAVLRARASTERL